MRWVDLSESDGFMSNGHFWEWLTWPSEAVTVCTCQGGNRNVSLITTVVLHGWRHVSPQYFSPKEGESIISSSQSKNRSADLLCRHSNKIRERAHFSTENISMKMIPLQNVMHYNCFMFIFMLCKAVPMLYISWFIRINTDKKYRIRNFFHSVFWLFIFLNLNKSSE